MQQDRSWLSDFDGLPSEKQSEVIDFIQFLKSRKQLNQTSSQKNDVGGDSPQQKRVFLEMAKDLIGIVDDAPSDLATNPKYMRNFGK